MPARPSVAAAPPPHHHTHTCSAGSRPGAKSGSGPPSRFPPITSLQGNELAWQHGAYVGHAKEIQHIVTASNHLPFSCALACAVGGRSVPAALHRRPSPGVQSVKRCTTALPQPHSPFQAREGAGSEPLGRQPSLPGRHVLHQLQLL